MHAPLPPPTYITTPINGIIQGMADILECINSGL